MSDLKSYIKENSTFVDWKHIAKHTFKFLNAKVVPNPYDADGETIEYTVEEEGVQRTFRSQSLALAQILVDRENQTVTLERSGTGTKTSWHLISEEDEPTI